MVDEIENGEEKRFHPGAWIGWFLAAVFLACALWLAHHLAWERRQLDIARGNAAQLGLQLGHADELVDVLTSQDSKHVVLSETRQPAHPGGEVSWLASKGALVFVAGGLKPLPAGKTYELWLVPAAGQAPIP
ncbi:MAG TPA: anti-sigma factor, partial [Acidobacteriaceae bacterium]|nr:anti-sigma factor [Acidobacteriaceae bacterium]